MVGGWAGREFGGRTHRNRDAIIGAVVGGLGANAAEQQFREWQERRRERRLADDYETYKYEGGGRSRSRGR